MPQTDGLSAILFVVVGLFFVKKIKAEGLRVWRRTIAPTRTARTPATATFTYRLIFVRTNVAFSASVLPPLARRAPLVSEREIPPLLLLAWAARLQGLSAA